MVREYIPVDKDNLPEQFEIDLGEETYILRFDYNQEYDFFTVDLYDASLNPIVLGEKMMLNRQLWADVIRDVPAPTLIPVDESGKATRITFSNFMETVFLFVDDTLDEEEPNLDDEVDNNGD